MVDAKTILLVDDETSFLEPARLALEDSGFNVISANKAEEALRLSEKHQGDIDLLLVDVVMPGLSGPELADKLTAARPNVKVLFISGYGPAAGVALKRRGIRGAYLAKPFSTRKLLRRVRKVLEKS